MYFPSFQYNLVSISKLSSQLQTFVILIDDTCLIHDPFLKNKFSLGAIGKRVNNPYVFEYHDLKQHFPYSFSNNIYGSYANIENLS